MLIENWTKIYQLTEVNIARQNNTGGNLAYYT